MKDVLIRQATPKDEPFIVKSWTLSNAEFTAEQFQLTSSAQHGEVCDLIATVSAQNIARKFHESSIRLIACYEGDPDSIFGFIVADPGVVHYCFTKFAARRMGIASALFAQLSPGPITRCTHWGFACPQIAAKHGLVYDPLARQQRNRT